jgi:hypothetical protein
LRPLVAPPVPGRVSLTTSCTTPIDTSSRGAQDRGRGQGPPARGLPVVRPRRGAPARQVIPAGVTGRGRRGRWPRSGRSVPGVQDGLLDRQSRDGELVQVALVLGAGDRQLGKHRASRDRGM